MREKFAQFISRVITGEILVPYKDGPFVDFRTLYAEYKWRGRDAQQTLADLAARRDPLRSALGADDAVAFAAAGAAVLTWGGVAGQNVAWLQERAAAGTLIGAINGALKLAPVADATRPLGPTLAFDDRAFQEEGLRSNAGFTKIYALLRDDFIIYDSRVAAALQMLVAMFLTAREQEQIPSGLQFVSLAAKGNGPNRRRVWWGSRPFPRAMTSEGRFAQHMKWNVAANSSIGRAQAIVRNDPRASWSRLESDPSRPVDFALFMLGEHLPLQFTQNEVAAR
jgi:hypothetical protein